jgi:hypothetical protein
MCLLYRFVYWIIPFRGPRAFILKKHFNSCRLCGEDNEIENVAAEFLSVPGWIKNEPSLWPQIRRRLDPPSAKKRPGWTWFPSIKGWRWAMALALFTILIVFSVWNQQSYVRRISLKETAPDGKIPQITIRHAEVNGSKAIPYVYQTTEVSFIWFSEAKKSGG